MAWSANASGTLSPCGWEGRRKKVTSAEGLELVRHPSPSHSGHMGVGQGHKNQG